MDVASLTCTSPNKRSAPGLTSSAPPSEKNTRFLVDSSDDNDPNELKKSTSLGLKYKSSRLYDIDFSSVDMLLKANQKCQGLEELEGHSSSSNNSGRGKELDCQYPSPVSSLEPSSSGGSCCSSDSKTSSITNGKSSNQSLLAKRLPVEVETELSDSASSTLAPSTSGNDVTATTFSLIDFKRSSKWELEFITKALCNAELILDDFVLGQVNNVMTPNLFDQLENQKTGFDEDAEQDCFNLGRKVLFDCEWLAEELHKEISSWASMEDLTVDELVDKDMSCWHGRWVDFETEAFEEGVEIEKGILTSLVDELVVDLFFI
ncbi:hypothetical protein LOK49_LG12G02543 [Camellia lanceoleosa]|uniref:Uncharacterized protein n=1 Tax=Camellia lanceoleosa TaxID=1840588 RepID=A0ACC0FTP5_9ERIC|nr:hypothetical protein LOK49_LG12G02543 [Camellia lanceoleosa]